MIKCTRRIEFDAGHRIIAHQNKCQFLHGHRYVLEVTIAANETDKLGMVVDFGLIKDSVKKWIAENFDHSLILHQDDKEIGQKIENHSGQKIYYMQNNPTAENIALHLKNEIFPKLFVSRKFFVTSLKLFETPNCFVEVQVLTTTNDLQIAEKITSVLLELKLAACVQIDDIKSYFKWEDKIIFAQEHRIVIKT